MKKILITGKSSFVGTSFEEWLNRQYPEQYVIEKISVRDNLWKKKDFSCYDAVLHVAGIAHIKETKKNAELYQKVNRDLAFEVAKKAKKENVKQFLFLSSMSVYGMDTGAVNKDTIPNPKSNYGISKLEAERMIKALSNDLFKVVILRPPMIYGRGCKGNYGRLAKIAVKTPIFPLVDNERSMIYIDNLTVFIKWIVDNEIEGLYFPQNEEYVNTSKMVELIGKKHKKKILLTKLFNPFLTIFKNNRTINKVFGSLTYERDLSHRDCQFDNFIDFNKSISLTEEER